MRYESHAGTRVLMLDEWDYRQLRRTTETYREELLVRLLGEVGLRPAEISRLRPENLVTREREGREHYFFAVAGPDEDGPAREAYLPGAIEHDVRKFVGSEAIGDDERIVPVTPRRVQMLVSDIAERVADGTGDDRFREVSTRTLRRYFAETLLVDERVHPRVVQAVGGWDSMASLAPYVEQPDADEIIRAFEQTSLVGRGGNEADLEAFRQAVEHSGHSIYVTDRDGVIQYVNPQFEEATGYTASDAIGRTPRILKSGEHDDDIYEELWETITDGDVWEGALVNRRKDGEPYRVHQTIAPISVEGAIEGYVAVNTDVPADGDWGGNAGAFARLSVVLNRLHAVREGVSAAADRSEAERTACERLADGDAYRFACFASTTGGTLNVRASAGLEEAAARALTATDGPAGVAVRTGEVRTVTDAAGDSTFDGWERLEGDRSPSIAAVPVVDGETTYGVLLVGADGVPFEQRERRLLSDLGERLGSALTVAEQRTLLLADSVTELVFRTTDPDAFFARASSEHGCEFTLEGLVPGSDGSLVYFTTVTGAAPSNLLAWMNDHDAVTVARLVRDHGDEALFEIVLTGPDPSMTVVRRGGTVTELVASDGVERVVTEVSPERDVRELAEVITTVFPASELVARRERERPLETMTSFRSALRGELTEKQAAVLEAAYHAGYFEWPRGSTAEALADAMGITSPTLHNHLRRAQQKLLVTFFEDDPGHRQSLDVTPWTDG